MWMLAACDCAGGAELKSVAPRLELDPASIDFGPVSVGDLRVGALMVHNRGELALRIEHLGLGPDSAAFTLPNAPLTALGAQESATIAVAFSPDRLGSFRGTIEVLAEGASAPRVVTLTGLGVAPGLRVAPATQTCGDEPGSISFGEAAPEHSVDRTLVIESTGQVPVRVVSAELEAGSSPAFTIDPVPASTVLEPGMTFSLMAHYRPTTGGGDRGTIVIHSDVAGPSGALRVPVCGQASVAAVCGQPVPLDLGVVEIGSSAHGVLHLTSCGLRALDVSAIRLSAAAQHPSDASFDISLPRVAPLTLAPGESIDVDVRFTPSSIGSVTGFVEVVSSAYGSPMAFFPVLGTGGGCALLMQPSLLNFGAVPSGQTASRTVVLSNSGSQTCSVTRLEVTSGAAVFSVQPPTLPLTIAAGGSVMVPVAYAPASSAPDRGRLEAEQGGQRSGVDLLGNPPQPAGCQLAVSPSVVHFGAVAVGTPRGLAVELANVGSGSCTLRSATILAGSSPGFTVAAPPATIPAGARQSVSITYQPTASGAATGVLRLDTTDAMTPLIDVPLSATAFVPAGGDVYIHTGGSLYSYDPTANLASFIGAFNTTPVTQMTDIAIDLTGHMFGLSGDARVWSIDPATAAASALFTLPSGGNGLTCLSDGTLVVAGTSLSVIDPATGQLLRTIVPTGQYDTSGDVIALPDGMLYWAVDRGHDRLLRVDPSSGSVTALPPLMGASGVYGLGFAGGQLLGFSASGLALVLDSSSGAITHSQPLSGRWNGATTNPVRW